MSLIERAIERLRNDPTSGATAGQPGRIGTGQSTAPPDDGPSLLERAAARFAAAFEGAAPGTAPPSGPGVRREPTARPLSHEPGKALHVHIEALRARGMVTPDAARTPVAEEFRLIKRPLLDNAFGRGRTEVAQGRRILVTSALPGEGKSFCAINLAMSIAAERDHQVVLVDADVAEPSIPRDLGFEPPSHGLMDWLLGQGPSLDELVRPTDIEHLSVLSSGRRHPQATELLASQAMVDLVQALTDRWPDRVFVFDSPPLLVTTEARALAAHMGQVVMVVEAGRTPRDAVTEALAALEGIDVIGLVLNKARHAERARSFGGYGYLGYGAA